VMLWLGFSVGPLGVIIFEFFRLFFRNSILCYVGFFWTMSLLKLDLLLASRGLYSYS
jgi:hypothetical protein